MLTVMRFSHQTKHLEQFPARPCVVLPADTFLTVEKQFCCFYADFLGNKFHVCQDCSDVQAIKNIWQGLWRQEASQAEMAAHSWKHQYVASPHNVHPTYICLIIQELQANRRVVGRSQAYGWGMQAHQALHQVRPSCRRNRCCRQPHQHTDWRTTMGWRNSKCAHHTCQ